MVRIISYTLIFLCIHSCSAVSSIGAVVGNASTSTRGFSASIDDTFLMTKIITKISGIELKKTEDSFASAANYLKRIGWKKNQPCFYKIELKENTPKKLLNSFNGIFSCKNR